MPGNLTMPYRLDELRRAVKPFKLHFFPRLRSTNDHAAALRRAGRLFAPAIVLTAHQLAGRGRGRNSWWSGPGSLTVTFVLPAEEHLSMHQVPLLAGLATRDAAAELTGDDSIQLKWPNDVLHDGRKLAGLLCERLDKIDLIGIGLNVNAPVRGESRPPGALRPRITFLSEIAGERLHITLALATLARHIHTALTRRGEKPFADTLHRYDQHHYLIGKQVQVIGADGEEPIAGRCLGLDSLGRLLIRAGRTTRFAIAGHVTITSPLPANVGSQSARAARSSGSSASA